MLAHTYEPMMRLAYTRAVSDKKKVNRNHLTGVVASLVVATGDLVSGDIGVVLAGEGVFEDLVNRLVEAYVNVIQPDESRQAILPMLPSSKIEQDKRIQDVIFLDKQNAVFLEKYRQSFLDSGFTQEEADKFVDVRRDKLVEQRGNKIATTETNRIINAVILETAKLHSNLDLQVVWIARDDRLTDKNCRALSGKRVKPGVFFSSPLGGYIEQPPLHPLCRCILGIRHGE